MGLFSKLKNVLFEEDEVEIPVIDEVKEPSLKKKRKEPIIEKENNIEEVKVVKKDFEPIKEEPKKEEPIKFEPKFRFPNFNASEFEEAKKEEPKRSFYDYDRSTRFVETKTVEEPKYQAKAPFKPSPVISPVYGILDKNYKKEDFKKNEYKDSSVVLDVDGARKKAFGTLEDDIENNINYAKVAVSHDEEIPKEKTISELLKEETDNFVPSDSLEGIKITGFDEDNNDYQEETKSIDDEIEEVKPDVVSEKEVLPKLDKAPKLEVLDEIEDELDKMEKEKKAVENDTLESDLFNLIDSMYEDRKE